ncbi:MAG: 50S ribosomal protein L9 [Candidatus Pacebacteria bacterium]|nr:50S ribosomal protein L9 [Candidatus Paceibacterota bacterium]
MKVILLQDIAKIGKKFDIKEMPNGYAAHLIRTSKVEMATASKLMQIESKKAVSKAYKEKVVDDLADAIAKIKKTGVNIVVKANDDGGMFEGITAVKLQEVIADSIVELPITAIILPEPIKEVGEYEVELVNKDKSTKIKLVISAEE